MDITKPGGTGRGHPGVITRFAPLFPSCSLSWKPALNEHTEPIWHLLSCEKDGIYAPVIQPDNLSRPFTDRYPAGCFPCVVLLFVLPNFRTTIVKLL